MDSIKYEDRLRRSGKGFGQRSSLKKVFYLAPKGRKDGQERVGGKEGLNSCSWKTAIGKEIRSVSNQVPQSWETERRNLGVKNREPRCYPPELFSIS